MSFINSYIGSIISAGLFGGLIIFVLCNLDSAIEDKKIIET